MLANLLHQTSLCLFQWFIQSFTLFSAQMNWRNISSITQDLHWENINVRGQTLNLKPLRDEVDLCDDRTKHNSQWSALHLAWSAQWIERCIQASQRSGSIPGHAWNFFSFFFNQVGCSIYCEDRVHFHLFIHSSKYDSLHLFQFMSTSFIERKILG